MPQLETRLPKRDDGRIIIHFDYDCFYAAVFEREDPKLRHLPFAVQQKQIIVTCNYEARRRGLHKLQLVKDARKKCPDVIIALGEDLTRFRDASKELHSFLRSYIWSKKVERLGFDEVFLDVSEMVTYNIDLLNFNNLGASFFHLDRNDPTIGFSFDGNQPFGHVFPPLDGRNTGPNQLQVLSDSCEETLCQRLILGSHLAQHLRHQLEEHKGYTSTVGISTNKLLSKLVGKVNKPKGQTTLIPPYQEGLLNAGGSNVINFLDSHDIGQIPGIGFKTAQKLRQYLLQRPAAFETGLVYGGTKENVSVRDVRLHNGMNAEVLERVLGGAHVPKGLGSKVWGLINGIDETHVGKAKDVPQQISIEDSYIKLDVMPKAKKEMQMLATSLIKRMRTDLMAQYDADDIPVPESGDDLDVRADSRHWVAHPRTMRLTTRARQPRNPDGSRTRIFNRMSKSCAMPSFVFNLSTPVEILATRLVTETLTPLFRRLHPEKSGWDLSLLNLCATNMAQAATMSRDGSGRDISRMFRMQEHVLKDWKIQDIDASSSNAPTEGGENGTENPLLRVQQGVLPNQSPITQSPAYESNVQWDSNNDFTDEGLSCPLCGSVIPPFANLAHQQFHQLPD